MNSIVRTCSPFAVSSAMAGVILASVGFAGPAHAQASADVIQQTLDRADVYSLTKAQGVSPEPLTYAVTATTGFTACQNTATRGLYCLDGKAVRNWPNPEKAPEVSSTLFSCDNSGLKLDRGGVCTALTVDLSGNIWLAGKKSNKFSLIKVIRKGSSSCPTGFTLVNSNHCAREYAAGRPLLIDISPVDGDIGANFPYGPGIIGLEERKTVVFFRNVPGATPITIASGKTGWGLVGSEQIHGTTLLQRTETVGTDTYTDNFALVTTSNGRVLAKLVSDTSSPSAFFTGFSLTAGRGAACPGPLQPALFEIRASSKSGQVFGTDKPYCRAVAAEPTFTYAPEDGEPTGQAFTLASIGALSTGSEPPEGVSVSPGINIDLRTCGETQATCDLIPDGGDGNQISAASLTGVTIEPGPNGLALFQIRNIPDCRYLAPSLQPAACAGAVINADGSAVTSASPPERQFLNVTPLLPPEVTEIFPPNSLPRMLVSPRYRALGDKDTFDALFGVTDDSVRFRETFDASFDIGDLLNGPKLGCGLGGPYPNLDWDIVVTISERYPTVGGPTDVPASTHQHVDMLVNKDCTNPTLGAGTRWSLYGYGLELAQEVTQLSNGSYTAPAYPDSIFAHLLASLAVDLGATQTKYACTTVDGGTSAPLSTSSCSTLNTSWNSTHIKLTNCINASLDPKTSAGAQNCQAFETQFGQYRTTLDALTLQGPDPANRLGELKARADVLYHVYLDHFYPSIPDGGFIDP